MSSTEFLGMFIGALAALLAVAIPIISVSLKLNTTLVKLTSIVEIIQDQAVKHEIAQKEQTNKTEAILDKQAGILQAHSDAINAINFRCRYEHDDRNSADNSI